MGSPNKPSLEVTKNEVDPTLRLIQAMFLTLNLKRKRSAGSGLTQITINVGGHDRGMRDSGSTGDPAILIKTINCFGEYQAHLVAIEARLIALSCKHTVVQFRK